MRQPWPPDHDVLDLFPSTTIGIMWFGERTPDIMDESRDQAGAILGLTRREVELYEVELLRAHFSS
jgi:hypothetical protein